MQNSAVVSRLQPKGNSKDVVPKAPGPKLQKPVASTAQSAKPPVRWLSHRKPIIGITKKSPPTTTTTTTTTTTAKSEPTPSTTPVNFVELATSDLATSETSLASHRTDGEPETTPKASGRFIKPRLNQLTQQRIFRLRQSQADAENAATPSQVKSPSLSSVSGRSESELGDRCVAGSNPCPLPLLALQKQLEDMQSDFMQKVSSFREQGFGYAYKLVTVIHNDTCKVVVHKDDLVGLPKNLPVKSVNDFKNLCHNAFKEGYTFIFEQIASVQTAKDEVTAAACREELRNKLKNELNSKLIAVDHELTQLCNDAGKGDSSTLMRQICDLSEANTQLKSTNAKLDADLADVRKNREELQRLLEGAQKRSNKLAVELADVNISVVEQSNAIDGLSSELKQMRKTNKILSQRLNENDGNLEVSRKTINQYVEHVEELAAQLQQAQADRLFLKKKTEELTLMIADKDRLMAEQKRQLTRLEQDNVLKPETTNNELDVAQIRELKDELERKRDQLTNHEQVEKTMREELEQKQEALRKAELKIIRLEEQIEHNRQVLAVRGERINSLDQEMKQREQESNRKINDIMAQTSDKNSLITQITNELASTNEQFQNLCTTLSLKQTKLHSQEHVIKLLEESNARSVKLHAKLGEKNALLKDELDHLRRTVNNLMVGSDISDVDVADILLE